MKKSFLLILAAVAIFLAPAGCMEYSEEEERERTKTFVSDNSELQEAKALTRKIYEGIEKVEKNRLSRAEFQSYAKPLQQKLNSLIINMEEGDVKELDAYTNRLMEELGVNVAQQE